MDKEPTVFISYSWDNEEQKGWVTNLVNLLRKNGVDASLDLFETQKGTINLNTMMVEKIKDSDYTIIILTEKYTEKANSLQGGVGFETSMLISYIQENMRKIIPIMNTEWNFTKTVPFYLKGVHYIDFSDRFSFNEKFKELLHRIYQVDLVEKAPLGKKPVLITRESFEVPQKGLDYINDMIPDFREITDLDKNKFMRESFLAIKEGFLKLLDNTKAKNSNFEFYPDDITNKKTIYKIYINGNQKYAVKIWLGNNIGSITETINLAYGNHISESDNSMNEIITCEVGKDKSLNLKMTMNMYGDKEANTPITVVKEIWKSILMWLN